MSECKTHRTKRYVAVATIWVLSILVTGLIISAFATTPSTTPWMLNAPPTSSASMIVGQYSNGTYFCESGDWQSWNNSASASSIINWALGNLTAGRTQREKVILASGVTFNIGSNNINVPDYTEIENQGTINGTGYLTNSNLSNCTEIRIHGGVLQGVGVNLTNTGATGLGWGNFNWIYDIEFKQSAGDAIHLYKSLQSHIFDNQIFDAVGCGIYGDIVGDGYVYNNVVNAGNCNFYWSGSGGSLVKGNYFGGLAAEASLGDGQVFLNNFNWGIFSDNRIDHTLAHGIHLTNTVNAKFSNTFITDTLATTSRTAIYMDGSGNHNNTWVNTEISRGQNGVTNWQYGILETGGAGYNRYIGTYMANCDTNSSLGPGSVIIS
jgi:hypothetical protein